MSARSNLSVFQNAIISWIAETKLIKDNSKPGLTLPDATEFFNAFKQKIKYNAIEDFNLISFLQEFYPNFEFQLEDPHNVCNFEHIYVYSLLLHFSCVDQKDQFFQSACLNMCHLHQGVIYKFLNILTDRQEFDKESLSAIINEASMPSHVPPLKIIQNMQSGMTPPTPKSVMLNSKTMKIRNLEAELISERNRTEEIEMQYQEKLREKQNEIDEMSAVNSKLQHEILDKESEMASMNCDREVDEASQGLMKIISEKNEIIHEYQQTIYSLNSENDDLSEKLFESEMAINENFRKIDELQDTIHSLEEELERQSTKSCALTSHIEGLNSFIVNSRRLDESVEALHFDEDLRFNNNNNSLEKSIGIMSSGSSPSKHSYIIKKRSFSIDIQGSLPLHKRNRHFHRSTTYKESERYLSIADEMLASGNHLKHDSDETDNDDTQLSIFFDSLHEGRRESVFAVKIDNANKLLERIKENDVNPEVSPAYSELLSQLKMENENLKKANETLALAQLATKRPKCGFKICVVS